MYGEPSPAVSASHTSIHAKNIIPSVVFYGSDLKRTRQNPGSEPADYALRPRIKKEKEKRNSTQLNFYPHIRNSTTFHVKILHFFEV